MFLYSLLLIFLKLINHDIANANKSAFAKSGLEIYILCTCNYTYLNIVAK